jgi:SAM-dependent methyltransferase
MPPSPEPRAPSPEPRAPKRSTLRRWVRRKAEPYALRLVDAFHDAYLFSRPRPGRHPRLRNSATHVGAVGDRPHKSGLWGYMLPMRDADAPVWRDGLPIPPQRLWHGYTDDTEMMMAIGERNAERVRRLLDETGGAPRPGDRVLDFGCGGGFVLRHFREIAEDRASGGEVWGVDLSGPHVEWCLRHLVPPFRFAPTSSFPSLPFADGYFDFAYCISVFSHMGEQCAAWLAELARVLRPGGRLYLSVVTREAMRDYFENCPRLGFTTAMHKRFTEAQLDSEFATAVVSNGPGCHSVYDLGYFTRLCEMCFETVRVEPSVHNQQWVLVLRTPAGPRGRDRAGAQPSGAHAAGPGLYHSPGV